eukprot:8323233-Alexandrium_andersonii.AAC.1
MPRRDVCPGFLPSAYRPSPHFACGPCGCAWSAGSGGWGRCVGRRCCLPLQPGPGCPPLWSSPRACGAFAP